MRNDLRLQSVRACSGQYPPTFLYWLQAPDWIGYCKKSIHFPFDEKNESSLIGMRQLTYNCWTWRVTGRENSGRRWGLLRMKFFTHAANKLWHVEEDELLAWIFLRGRWVFSGLYMLRQGRSPSVARCCILTLNTLAYVPKGNHICTPEWSVVR